MILVEDVIRDVVNAVKMPFVLSNKSQINSFTFSYDVTSTWYLSKGMRFEINGNTYTVTAIVRDTSFTITSTSGVELDNGVTYYMPAPYYIHGKYLAVNAELAQLQNPLSWNPLIWLFRRGDRTRPEEFDSKFESEGDVRLFLMSSSDWGNYDTQDHYDNVIKPLTTFVDAFKVALLKQLRIVNLRGFSYEFHAKFTTGGDSLSRGDAKAVLPDTQSGIEIVVDIPIRKDYNCFN